MQVKNKYRKANGDISLLSENLFEGVDADLYVNIQTQKGLTNLAFFSKFKQEFSKSLANAIPTMGTDNVAESVKKIIDKFKDVVGIITSLYGFVESQII